MTANDAASICKALGDPNRLQIVRLLTEGEQCTCHLLGHFQIAQPTLTHHMRVLAECGLLHSRKEGRWTFYSLDCATLTAFRELIAELDCSKNGGRDERDCCDRDM